MQQRTIWITIAALLYLLTGIGYSLGTIPITLYLIRNRSLPNFGGIRFYAGSFFDRHGIAWVIGASLAFIACGIAFLLAGYWLWNSMRIGGIAALLIFPIVIVVSIGSLAPFPWLIEPVKLALVLLGWSSLR